MANEKNDHTEENFATIETALGKSEQFIEKNKNILVYGTIGLFALVLVILGYNKYIRIPNQEEAYNKIWHAEQYFAKDSFNLALNGDGVNPGFIEIIDDFGSTPSGNLAQYYAGICYFNLAQNQEAEAAKANFESALEYLEDFSSDDLNIMPMALGVMGDCQMELGDMEKAVAKYEDAARHNDNEFMTPLYLKKAGITYSVMGKHDKALQLFEEIKTKYFRSFEYSDIKKYIAREEQLLGK
jgi:tetratricopeptide (TPR) repeat protein